MSRFVNDCDKSAARVLTYFVDVSHHRLTGPEAGTDFLEDIQNIGLFDPCASRRGR